MSYHINVKGWTDVGYHAGIEQVEGRFVCLFGRPDVYTGAHTRGHNSSSLGFVFIGGIAGVVAIVLGVIGKKKAQENPTIGGRGMSIAGIVMGIIGIIFTVLMIILIVAAVSMPFWALDSFYYY